MHSIPSPNIVNIDVLIAKHYQEDWDGDRDDEEEEEEEEARESPSQEEDGSQVEVEEGEVSLATGVLSSLGWMKSDDIPGGPDGAHQAGLPALPRG